MNYEKTPFKIYDVFGYLTPGMIAILYVFFSFHYTETINFLFKSDTSASQLLVIGFLLLICSYVLGHCIALLSSFTSERLAYRATGYPSEFLTGEGSHKSPPSKPSMSVAAPESVNELIAKNIRNQFCDFVFLFLIILPFFIFVFAMYILCILCLWEHLLKRMQGSVIRQLDKRFSTIFQDQRSTLGGVSPSRDWFILVEYYVIHNLQVGAERMYNYLTLYGFCRNASLAFYIGAWVLFAACLLDGFTFHKLMVILLSLLVSILLFFGFIKFSRRYSQEAILSFSLSDFSTKQKSKD